MIDIDRAKAAYLGLTQADVIQNVVAALNSSIQFNKKNFWIDPVSHNQYFVGVQYPEADIRSVETCSTSPSPARRNRQPVPLRNVATIHRMQVPAEVNHTTLQATIDLTMGVSGRDLGHVADDVAQVIDKFGELGFARRLETYEVDKNQKPIVRLSAETARVSRGKIGHVPKRDTTKYKLLDGGKLELVGEYARMQDTFRESVRRTGPGLAPHVLPDGCPRQIVGRSVYRDVHRSPLAGGRDPHAVSTGTALNVQSLLGIIFIVGIKVANTVLLSDFAQELRRHEGLTPTEAVARRRPSACGP